MLTVKEPTDDMIEVSIASTQAAIGEGKPEAVPVA
jgi:uncharacterized protein YqhQ